jgi:UDP-glucose 4-epimerase
LLQLGNAVDVIDAFYKGKKENLPSAPNVALFEGDLADANLVERVLARKPTGVLHLAAHHFIPYCMAHPTETIRCNVLATQTLLEGLEAARSTAKVVYASTAAVYAPSERPHAETDSTEPIDIYGVSKLMGEQLVQFHCKRYGLPYAAARLFNVIGPREANPHLVPDIIRQLQGNTLQLGNLSPRRDYIFVDDVASGLLRLLDDDVPSGAYNVGNGRAYSTTEVVESIGRALGRKLEIDPAPLCPRACDRPVLQSDCSKLRRYGWAPKYSLDDALAATLKSYGY